MYLRTLSELLPYLENEVGKPRSSEHKITDSSGEGNLLYTHHQNNTAKLAHPNNLEGNLGGHFKLLVINTWVDFDSIIIIGNSQCTLQ